MEERKLVWNPFKKEYWKKDNLLPPEKREIIKQNATQMKGAWKEGRAVADEMFGKNEPKPEPVVAAADKPKKKKKKRVFFRLVWMIGAPLILTILFGPIGTGIGAIIFIIGLVGLLRK